MPSVSPEAVSRNGPADHMILKVLPRGIVSACAERYHQWNQMLLARMREPRLGQPGPISDSPSAFCRIRLGHRRTERLIEPIRLRGHVPAERAHIVKAHAGTDDQHAIVAQRCE